jgi:5-methyltetrahydrofolate--homocysteine methyltransferase
VYADAQVMLQKIIQGRWLSAQAVVGFYPANSQGDDIELYADESRTHRVLTWRNYRQQSDRPIVNGLKKPNRCLADFVAPKDSGVADYVGMFAVTAGIGIEKKLKEFEAQHDDYSSIMLKALADRLAEAFAERMHQRVRTELWGYASDEHLQNEDLIAEKYTGIRPAPGYPACPDHSVKEAMFDCLQAQEIGMSLTESLAMLPASSVSGFYIANQHAQYFDVGRVGDDQQADFAKRPK